ncbi:MAG: hypothetical protein IT178_11330 [Acidobacteria bacterium]|nr:hypothetical protein [Acidobacteriota bacterium]
MRPLTIGAGVLLLTVALAGAAAAPTPQQADAFALKLARIQARGNSAPSGARTEVPNDELNAYLRLRYASMLPSGVADPSVTMAGPGRLSGRAIVDLDGIRKKSSGGWFDPAAYLSGRLPVTAVGTLRAVNGKGEFVLERADVSGIPVPTTLIQELVTYYTTSPELPEGFRLDRPFDLPSSIQRIDVVAGHATVVQ